MVILFKKINVILNYQRVKSLNILSDPQKLPTSSDNSQLLTIVSFFDIIRIMRKKHAETLNDIFHTPVLSSVKWSDIETLFISLGAKVFEGRGSRVKILLNDRVSVFHRPHPQKETDKGALVSVRRFLEEAGVKP